MATKVVLEVIENNKSRLAEISHEIWSHPELPFKEQHALTVITKFLDEEGFKVESGFVTPTGLRAVFTSPWEGDQGVADKGVHVCFLCEYDAVAGVGHGAGHNLTTEASLAAAAALKECMMQKLFKGKITVLGTPAEDSGQGTKIDMIQHGAFKDVDIVVMLNPYSENILFPHYYTLVMSDVTYKGKAAHASVAAWDGRNALDAAVACYNNVALLRQQMKPTWQINGIITHGGVQPNVIPYESRLSFWLRAPNHTDLIHIQQKVQACIMAAGKATGCEVDVDFQDKRYQPLQHNLRLGQLYKKYATELGMNFPPLTDIVSAHIGSSDMGNVSFRVPSLSPAFHIGTTAAKNSMGFVEAAGSPVAQEHVLRGAKAAALAAAEVMGNKQILQEINDEYITQNTPSGLKIIRKDKITEVSDGAL